MKFCYGKLPDTEMAPGTDWHQCKEPDAAWFYFMLVPMVSLLLGVFVYYAAVHNVNSEIILSDAFYHPYVLILVVILHEGLHAVFHPDYGITDKTWIGCIPHRLVLYCYFEGERSRKKFSLGNGGTFSSAECVAIVDNVFFSLCLLANCGWRLRLSMRYSVQQIFVTFFARLCSCLKAAE